MSGKTTLRQRNAARTRVGILNAALDLVGRGPAETVPVEMICERVGISTVTFFNYFPRRDTLMLFFAWTWWLRCTIELRAEPLKATAALRRTFRSAAGLFAERPGFTLGFISLVTRMAAVRDELEAFCPTRAEKELLHPDVAAVGDLEILRLDQQWVRHIQEAIAVGELPADTVPGEMVMVLGSVLYGVPIMAVIGRRDRIDSLYEAALDRILVPTSTAPVRPATSRRR